MQGVKLISLLPVQSLSDPCGGLHHIRLKFVLGRGVEKPFGVAPPLLCWARDERRGHVRLFLHRRTNVDKPKRKPKHFGNASDVVPLYGYIMVTDQSCKGYVYPGNKRKSLIVMTEADTTFFFGCSFSRYHSTMSVAFYSASFPHRKYLHLC